MDNIPAFDEITKITEQVKKEKEIDFLKKMENGRNDAIKHITIGCKEKMFDSAKKGYDKTILYSFKWTDEKKASEDSDGNKTEFVDDVKLHDLIKKDTNFIKELDSFFNNHCNECEGTGVKIINRMFGNGKGMYQRIEMTCKNCKINNHCNECEGTGVKIINRVIGVKMIQRTEMTCENCKNKFHTGFFSKKDKKDILTWNIYVSWGAKKLRPAEIIDMRYASRGSF